MKTLRVLFLAALAMALTVSGAFAANLPTTSFDVYIGGSASTTAKSTLSVDILSSDTVKAVSFDFTNVVAAGYVVSYDTEDENFTVTSAEVGSKKVWTLTFTPTATATAETASFTFNFYSADNSGSSTDGDDKTTATLEDITANPTSVTLSADKKTATVKVTVIMSAAVTTAPTGFTITSTSTDVVTVPTSLTFTGSGMTWSADLTLTAGTKSGDATVTVKSGDISADIAVTLLSADAGATAVTEFEPIDNVTVTIGGTETVNVVLKPAGTITGEGGDEAEEVEVTVAATINDGTEDKDVTDEIEVENTLTLAKNEDDGTYTGTLTITGGTAAADGIIVTLTYGEGDDAVTTDFGVVVVDLPAAAAESLKAAGTNTTTASATLELAAADFTSSVAEITVTMTLSANDDNVTSVPVTLEKDGTNGNKFSLLASDNDTNEIDSLNLTVSETECTGTFYIKWTDSSASDEIANAVTITYNTSTALTATIKIPSGVTKAEASTRFEERLLRQSYAAAAGEAEYTLTFTVNYKVTDDTETKEDEGTRGISWGDTTTLQNWDGKLVVSGDTEEFEVTLIVSDDYAKADYVFELKDKPTVWSLDWTADGSTTGTDGNTTLTYLLQFIPGTESQDADDYKLYAYIDGSEDIATKSIDVTVAVVVSSDAEDSSSTDSYTLKMVTPVVSSSSIRQGETATVKIAVTPMRALGTYTFVAPAANANFTITSDDEKQDTSAQSNTKTYRFQAKIDATTGSYPFTFRVTSGDGQSVSATETLAITALNLNRMTPEEAKKFITDNPAPTPKMSKTAAELRREIAAALQSGDPVTFRMTSEWPVSTTGKGWRVMFKRNNSFFSFLMQLMQWAFNGRTWTNAETSAISAILASNDASAAGAMKVEIESATEATYTLEPVDMAAALTNGQTFSVQPAIIPEAYEDVAGVSDEDKASETESIGEITGTNSSTPGGETPGGDTPGGDEPGGDTEDLVDKVLGGSSGGCDAGFGTLALALAAALLVSKKRS